MISAFGLGVYDYLGMENGLCYDHPKDPNCPPQPSSASQSPAPVSTSPIPDLSSSTSAIPTNPANVSASATIPASMSTSPLHNTTASPTANVTSTSTPTGTSSTSSSPSPLPQRSVILPSVAYMPLLLDSQIIPSIVIQARLAIRDFFKLRGFYEMALDTMRIAVAMLPNNNCVNNMHGANSTAISGGRLTDQVPINIADAILPGYVIGTNGTFGGGGTCTVKYILYVFNYLNQTMPISISQAIVSIQQSIQASAFPTPSPTLAPTLNSWNIPQPGSRALAGEYTAQGEQSQARLSLDSFLLIVGIALVAVGYNIHRRRAHLTGPGVQSRIPADAVVIGNLTNAAPIQQADETELSR